MNTCLCAIVLYKSNASDGVAQEELNTSMCLHRQHDRILDAEAIDSIARKSRQHCQKS